MLPVGLWGGQARGSLSSKYLPSFCCSVMKANTEQALRGQYDGLSAVIMTAFCDTLKCLMENWRAALPELKIIPIVYAQNRKSPSGQAYMREEFARVKARLEELCGVTITDEALWQAAEVYDDWREAMQRFVALTPAYPQIFTPAVRHLVIKAAFYMDKKVYTRKLLALMDALPPPAERPAGLRRVILTGLMSEPPELLELLEDLGYQVVGDDLAQESRQFRTASDRRLPPLERMAERLSRMDGCSFLYDENKLRGAMLLEQVRQTGAEAVIFCQMKFCDPEEFDYAILKREFQQAGVPLLQLELEQQMDSMEQLRTRLQSMAEILEANGGVTVACT
ncbi:(R)-2-hydroxyisocaproyl-CoA dehydratase beta subunit [bioreactor metagenome]|uniref:(R)-2-hydroxyisocaproyl-CoA dehydratase beta subunit n=1 Tax=bioreactor metagenome TaxID=1076179 RepID=A0A645CXB7_9ZZZZ